jgi:pyridoxal phosphate enzyme (YggS family)
VSDLDARLGAVRAAMAEAAHGVGRNADDVTLVAVTKTVAAEQIRDAYDAGVRVFGENRVQEGAAKITQLDGMPGASWHLIGHLQSNKVKPAIEAFAMIESVDSLRLAQRIDQQAETMVAPVAVLLEVNISGEQAKGGFSPGGLLEALPQLLQLPHLAIRGLMTVAPLVRDPEEVRPIFRALRLLRDELRDRHQLTGFGELSMGMSNDYRVAIQEGATMVRVGRALFGERPAPEG